MVDALLWGWHGVLGLQGFWEHPARGKEELAVLRGFAYSGAAPWSQWRLGQVTTHEVAAQCGANVDQELVVEQLYAGWPNLAYMNVPLLRALQQTHPHAMHWIVTDNIDVFTLWLQRQSWFAHHFAGVINSADHGQIKRRGLFPIALAAMGVEASQTVLVDATAENRAAFQALGGTVIRIPAWTPNRPSWQFE